jgi:hypothetical protein
MTDIVERLPKTAAEVATRDAAETANACIEAAAEIERLRAEKEWLDAQMGAWARALGKRRRTP